MRDINLSLTQGNFSLHITRNPAEIQKAQELRYRVFFTEMAGRAKGERLLDVDEYDPLCDHMIVYEHIDDSTKVIGTYRFLRSEFVHQVGKFYTQTEFDLTKLLANYTGQLVEVGRSCIDSNYRTGAVIKLLWRGIAMYLTEFNLDLMFGCASFKGDDPEKHSLSLSYLHHFHRIEEALSPTPLDHVKAHFSLIPKDQINEKRTFALLPPLIKGYLRLGGKVGEGAVIDHNVNTTDVCIIVDKKNIGQRYLDFLASEGSDRSES